MTWGFEMHTAKQGLATGVFLAALAVGFAAPASAEPPPTGTYTATVTVDTAGHRVGKTSTVFLTSCGMDCVHLRVLESTEAGLDLHLQDGSWLGSYEDGNNGTCTDVLTTSLVVTDSCGNPPDVLVLQLDRTGD